MNSATDPAVPVVTTLVVDVWALVGPGRTIAG